MQDNSVKAIPSNRLQFFPIMMFATIMGLAGLSLVYEKMSEKLLFPSIIVNTMLILTTIIFVVVLFSYLLKIVKHKEDVKKELKHPVRINFFPASSISMLLLSMLYANHIVLVSKVFFIIGASLHLFFTFYTIKFWINNDLEVKHSNPAWFIPIVGNLIVPIAGVNFADKSILYFYFSIGIFFWVILLSIILNRLIFHKQFEAKFMPTLFILIAPPSIGFISYIKLTGSLDFFAHFLYSLALFFTILIFVMYKNFVKIKFFISWWAFTFPMAAVTLSTILMYSLTNNDFHKILSCILTVITTLVVFFVAVRTISHMRKKEICIME